MAITFGPYTMISPLGGSATGVGSITTRTFGSGRPTLPARVIPGTLALTIGLVSVSP